MKVAFLGDISLNDKYVIFFKNRLNPFSEVESVLRDNDFVVGNLESIAQGEHGENLLKSPRLTTTIDTLNYLKLLNINLVSLAHNHIYDQLEDGFNKTINFLNNNGIMHLGAGYTAEEASIPLIIQKDGISVGLLNYVTKDTNPNLAENAGIKLNIFEWSVVQRDIKELRPTVDHIVLLMHWGGKMEGSMFPNIEQPKLARKIIDAGADLILGHHSHTLQPFEIYKGKHIFYSIGNFCFSNVISEGKFLELNERRMSPSIILNVNFNKSNYSINYQRTINSDGHIKLNNSANSNEPRQIFFDKSLLYNSFLWSVYFFYEKRVYPVIAYFLSNNRNPIKQLMKVKWGSVKNFFS